MLTALTNRSNLAVDKNFFLLLGLICLSYLALECVYIPYAAFKLDDFWLGYHNYQYLKGIPYRDFAPYKTVLGYYIFLLPLALFHGPLAPLIYTKLWIALINTCFLVSIALWLKKFFNSFAVITTLILIVPTQVFLAYSVDIRVDLLAYWVCIMSLLFILEEKYILAGLAIGLSFTICQKSIWYIIATNCGLACVWFFEGTNWKHFKALLQFNLSTLLILLVYLSFWTTFSSLAIVLKSVLYEPFIIAQSSQYLSSNLGYWVFLIDNNPGYLLLPPLAFYSLLIFPLVKRPFIIGYILTIVFFILNCKQPFPYFLLVSVPALFLIYCSFFSVAYRRYPLYFFIKKHKKTTFVFSILYLIGLFFLSYQFALRDSYLLAALIPLLLFTILFNPLKESSYHLLVKLIFVTIILLGVFFPILAFIQFIPTEDGRYQKSTIYLMHELLKDSDTYIAGAPLIHNIEQPVPSLVHLTGPSIDYLYNPSLQAYPTISLKSLNFSTDTIEETIEAIKKGAIKLYVDNNRFHYLPPALHQYLATQYQHFWGSIFLYAPTVNAGQQTINIKFSGSYLVKASQKASIYLNNQKISANSIVDLEKQLYYSKANNTYRLELIPPVLKKGLLAQQFQSNHWEKVFK